ncbi:MAG: MG2 domain-containing protein [Campylobacteraceae bacterium]
MKTSAFYKSFVVVFGLLFMLVFLGCEDKNKDNKTVVSNTDNVTAKVTISKEEKEKQDKEYYKNKEFKIVDVSEMNVDNTNSIAITFSTPLKEKQDFSKYIEIFDKTKNSNVDGAWELSKNKNELYFKFIDPQTTYVITVNNPAKKDGGIENIAGNTLVDFNSEIASFDYTIETKALYPMIGFASTASLLPSKILEGLPVTTINVKEIDINFYRVDASLLPSAIERFYGKSSAYTWDTDQWLNKGFKLVYTARFDLNPPKNTRENMIIPIKDIKELQKDGVYVAVMKQAGKLYDYTLPSTLFTISNIGLSLHVSSNGDYEVFTQDLESGKALANVDIKVIENKGGSVKEGLKTDAKGYLKLTDMPQNAIVIATKNGATSFISTTKASLDLAEFPVGGAQNYDKTLFAFGPRDIYRPGELLLVNALLRDYDGKKIDDQPIKVDILLADGKTAKTFTWEGKDGFYQYNFRIPSSAPTGNWHLRFNLGDDKYRFYNFKVEDFLPEKMALEINASKTPLLKNANVNFDVYGKYLYGAPASGNKLMGQILLRPIRNAPLTGFFFGSIRDTELSRPIASVDTTLNKEGKTNILIYNDWNYVNSPVAVVFEASLMESGGRPVSRTIRQDIWPSANIPAIKPTFGQKRTYDYNSGRYVQQFSVDEDSFAEFEIVFINEKGEKLKKDNLHVNLIRERRNYYWHWSENGWYTSYSQKDIPMEDFDISVESGQSTKIGFNVEWGPYVVEVTDKDSGAISSVRFWAGYSWQDSSSQTGSRPEAIKLKLDKPSYKNGDVAKVSVEAPEAGNGYLMVESGDGVLWWQEISVPKEGKTFEIPVNSEWQKHDIYVTAQIVRAGDKNSHATPKRAMGVLHLPLFRDDRKIDFALDVPAQIEPNQKINVKVKANLTAAQKGKTFKAIVSAVDSGILSITQFDTPDPFNAFFGKRWFDTRIYDVYGNVIEGAGKLGTFKFGGDGIVEDEALSRAGKKPVTKVLIVALQSDAVTLDSSGEAVVSFNIPDFNGELRFMAQVWSEDDFASSEKKTIVAAPLVLELGHPRFLASGDTTRLALDLNNLSGKWQSVKLSMKTTGLLALDVSADQTISIDDKQKATAYIPIRAKSGFGSGDVEVTITGFKDESGVERTITKKWTIGVRPPFSAQTFSLLKTLNENDKILKSEFENGYLPLDPDSTEAQIIITSIPPLNLAEVIRELYAYPYGCLEQTTSGLYPSIYTNSDQLAKLGIKSSNDTERRKNIELGIERLLGMQKTNGSFGFWSSDSVESIWGTVYVTDFLLRAKEMGYNVSANALNKAVERLRYYLNTNNLDGGYTDSSAYTIFSVRSYAGYVLARTNQANIGNLRALYNLADSNKSALSTMQLGIALKLMGDNEKGEELINKSVSIKTDRGTRWYSDYGSDIRDNAMMLFLANEHNLFANTKGQMLLNLSNNIKNRRYFSTQERNAIFLAGKSSILSQEPNWEAQIDINGNAQNIVSNKEAFTKFYNYNEIGKISSITNKYKNPLYATINIIGYPLETPKPYSNGLNIKREYYSLSGTKIELNELKSGDLVIVALHVNTTLYRVPDALVVDLLPAGLELENQNLGHSSIDLSNSEAFSKNGKLVTQMQQTTINHQEYRDDRYVAAVDVGKYNPATLIYLARAVTPGNYRVPPPFVESMYTPTYYSIGETPNTLHVK